MFNPIKTVENAASDVGGEINEAKKRLVKYVTGRRPRSGSPITGQGNRQPKYYRNGKKSPFRRP